MADRKLALIIETLVRGAKDVVGLTDNVKALGAQAEKKIPDNTEALREGAKATKVSVEDLTNAIGGLVTLGAITQFARSSVQEFSKAESAFRGLEAVATASGAGIGNALKEAEALAADGLIGVSDASKALQNLLSRGYNLDQAVATITRLKDAAAFNRQGSLSMAEAVVSATEGLKNENSILVDNAGVTKNVAKIWEDYAKAHRITTAEMTQAQKIEAEVAGILAETAAQAGNAAKAVEGFQGQMAQSDQAVIQFKQSLGEGLAPTLANLAKSGTSLIESFFKPLLFLTQAAGVRIGQTALAFGVLWDAATSFDFSQVRETLARQGELAEKEIEDIARRLSSKSLKISDTLTGGADASKAKEVADKLADAGAAGAKVAKEQAKDLTKSIQQSIQDYQKLAEAARAAWQESLKSEKDYLDEAKRLRAGSATADTSTPQGQAEANLALLVERQKLERLVSTTGTSYETIKAQADAVREMAKATQDEADAKSVLREADLAQARGAEAAAAAEKTSQEGLRDQWQQSEQVVKDLQTALDAIGEKRAITIESDQAKAVLAQITADLDALKDKTITIKVVRLDAAGQPLDNLTQTVPGHAAGTLLSGYGGGDRRLALLEDGEGVLRKEAIAKYGASFFWAVNRLQLPRFASGGLVLGATGAMPSLSASDARAPSEFPDLGRITLELGGGAYPVYAEAPIARDLARAARKLGAAR